MPSTHTLLSIWCILFFVEDAVSIAAPMVTPTPTTTSTTMPAMEVSTTTSTTMPAMEVSTTTSTTMPAMEVSTTTSTTMPAMEVSTTTSTTMPAMEVSTTTPTTPTPTTTSTMPMMLAPMSTPQATPGMIGDSGSGGDNDSLSVYMSGNGMTPMLDNCPNETIFLNLTRSVNPTLSVQANADIDFPMALNSSNSSVIAFSSYQLLSSDSRLIQQDVAIQVVGNTSNIQIAASGDLVGVASIVLQVSLVAMYEQLETCEYRIEIAVLTPPNCTVEENQSPFISLETATRLIYSVSITLDIPLANLTSIERIIVQIQTEMSIAMNQACPMNCNNCNMENSCSEYIAYCQEFSTNNVELFGEPTAAVSLGLRRRRAVSSSATVVTFFVSHPTGAPLSGMVALVPLSTTLSVVERSISTLQNATGVTVLGVEPRITNVNIISTSFIAQIVLPICITLLVLVLVGGIITVFVIVYLKKNKVKPSGHNRNSTSSQQQLL